MNPPLNYPLEQMMTIKKNRFDQAMKILEEKKRILEQAQKKLQEVIKERDDVLKHKNEKLEQLRHSLDTGEIKKAEQAKIYLKIVQEKLLEKEKKVTEQKKQVDLAQKQVELATQDLFQKKKDLEKLEIHKSEWEKEVKYWTTQKEAVEGDEQGSTTFELRRKEEKRRKK